MSFVLHRSGPFGIDDEICQVTTRLMACLSRNSAGEILNDRSYSHEKVFASKSRVSEQ